MATANDELLDAMVRHQVGLLRFGGSVRDRVLELLDQSRDDLAGRLRERLAQIDDRGPETIRRLGVLESLISGTRTAEVESAGDLLEQEMIQLSQREPEFFQEQIAAALPVTYDFVTPSNAQLSALVRENPMEGRVLRDWVQDLARDDRERILAQIRIGMTQGESTDDIVRRVVGRKSLNYEDGVAAVTRRRGRSLVRTSVNHYANAARREFMLSNRELIEQEQYVATLDGRTTVQCASLDGELFPLDKGPRPPIHFNCRSTRVPAIAPEPLVDRPAKRNTRAELEGLSRAERRRRIREMTGTVPGKTSYEQFLRRQPVQFQNEVLGATKARLFREGGLSLDKFVDYRFEPLTLDQLRRREADLFESLDIKIE